MTTRTAEISRARLGAAICTLFTFALHLMTVQARVPRAVQELAQAGRGSGFWSARGTDLIDDNGNVIHFSGVMWAGFETPKAVFGGLNVRTYDDFFDQIASLGFNMLRLPFAGDTLLPSTMPGPYSIDANPDLQGLTSLEVMDKMIDACTKRGIKVILDYHRLHLTDDNELGTWWDATTPESVWLNNWAMLAKRYKGNPTVIGADLFNEVHPNPAFPDGAPFWVEDAGANEAYNFRSASIRAIAAIHAVEPNWMIFMEGMHNNHAWWGGNCAELLTDPITEPKNKLAYSAHDYGPYVAPLAQFFAPDFPDNLIPRMASFWGVVLTEKAGPLWVGEFGSVYPPDTSDINHRERLNFQKQIQYIGQINPSWTLAFWGPDTKDTGSILLGDWQSVNTEKMAMLKPIMHPNFV